MNTIHDAFATKGLVRSRDRRLIAGVASGIGQRFGIGPWTARLLFLLILMVIPGSQILVYPILWILMPSEERAGTPVAPLPAGPAPAM